MKRDRSFTILLTSLIGIIAMLAIALYMFMPNHLYAVGIAVAIAALIIYLAKKRKAKFFALAAIIVCAIGALVTATFIIDSMLKGIELVSGVQEGMFLFLPKQYGLMNTQDALFAIITFIFTVLAVSAIVAIRQRYKHKQMI